MNEHILSNIRSGNHALNIVHNTIAKALTAEADWYELEDSAKQVDEALKCAGAHFAQSIDDLKAQRGEKQPATKQ